MTTDLRAQALRYSGDFWSSRLEADQLPLARQIASLLADGSDRLSQVGSWVQGEPTATLLHAWTLLPDDVQVQGPDLRGRDLKFLTPAFNTPNWPLTDRIRVFLSAADVVVETQAGDDLPEGLTLSEQTVWFIPRPAEYAPVLLITEQGPLVEGTGFIVAGDWIMLYQDPTFLWSGTVVGHCVRLSPSGRSSTLSADRLFTSGRQLANYRRRAQNLKQFELALCEAAGIPVLEQEGYVARIESRPNGSLHWLVDGRQFLLPGTSPYRVGSRVDAWDGHILRIRHQNIQGPDWWRNRGWSATGVPIFAFRPGFYGTALKDQMVGGYSYLVGSDLHARLALQQDSEEFFWTWQERQEKRMPAEQRMASILGFTAAGQTANVNALGFFVGVAGPWFGVVETSLDVSDTKAFRAVLDFVARERPAGTMFYVHGESDIFGNELLFDTYLHTGELVFTDEQILTVRPAY